MKVLVVGGGGREHALAWKLAQEAEVHIAPGNPGTAAVGANHAVSASDTAGLVALCRSLMPSLVVVGPEDPLIAGLADALRAEGFAVAGPGAAGATLEGSKAFSKELMAKAGVPTARYGTFTVPEEAARFAQQLFDDGAGAVVKASGAALGKGVVVAADFGEAEAAIRMMMVDRALGDAGAEVVVEERLAGREFSLLTLCSDAGFFSLPVAQDYKRALDGDLGPNTGGMGTYSPVPWLDPDVVSRTEAEVVAPLLKQLVAEGVPYRGVLFSGLMVDGKTPKCLEYNVRFGDPETQTVMRRLGAGFLHALLAVASGDPIPAVQILDHAAVTVVLASGGYPGNYRKGVPIEIGDLPEGVVLFHAGTSLQDGQLVTSGGRVFGLSAVGPTVSDARDLAYQALGSIRFEGMSYRTDIAATTA